MARHRSKRDLPAKRCPVCQRSFVWRRKWASVWEGVVYCSERCRRTQRAQPVSTGVVPR
ncbi:MAG: DUF2256 domain-containing protein [Rhodospirillales bacterium]|nr:DUF2256 domain-containing protein [Rhodospirillales bacterium]